MILDDIKDVLNSKVEVIDDKVFDQLALGLYEYHCEKNSVYKKFAATKPVPSDWKEIPHLPIQMFKHADVMSWSPHEQFLTNPQIFYSSGTTQANKSRHMMQDTEFYDASMCSAFSHFMLSPSMPWGPYYNVVCLSPKLENSSLYHMFETLLDQLGSDVSTSFFHEDFSQKGILDLFEKLSVENIKDPILVLGTSLAFYEIVTHLPDGRSGVAMPQGSKVMETGGFKKRDDITMTPYQLAYKVMDVFTPHHAYEYGMSEMSSQLYSVDWPLEGEVAYESMGWLRYRIVDPVKGKDVPAESQGVIQFTDLANVYSMPFIQTEDIGWIDDQKRLRLIGRAQGAAEKGCSLTFEQAMKAQEK